MLVKMDLIANIKVLKHCKKLFKDSNEIKRYMKNTNVKSH